MTYHHGSAGGGHGPYGPRAYGPSGGPTRRGGGVPDGLLVGALGVITSVTLLLWSSTGIAGWLRHGAWPEGVTLTRTAVAVRSFLTAPSDVPGAWPDAAPAALPSAALLWLVFCAQLAIAFATVLWAAMTLARWRARRRGRGPHATRPASPERPSEQPAEDLAEESIGNTRQEVRAEVRPERAPEDEQPPAAAPERGAGAVARAPGGLVVPDPDGTLWERTARQRTKKGPVHVYDPGHATDAPVRLRWAPQRGCEDMAHARRRAVALLAPVRPSEPVFQLDAETAETLLRCFLHAAALAGEPFPHVHRWAQGRAGGEPTKILRRHPKAAPGASMELESALTSHPGRRDAGLDLIGSALRGLEQLHIRQACSPGRVDQLALENLAGEDGTLYVVGDDPDTAPFRSALLDTLTDLDRVPATDANRR